MSHLSEKDYTKLANAIADDFINKEIPLNDSVTKLASKMGMNHDQIRRTCEATNNTVFNKLLRSKTASDNADRVVEFDVADPKVVIASFVKEEEKTAEAQPELSAIEYWDLPNEFEETTLEKTATTSDFVLRPESSPSKEVEDRLLMKVAQHAQHEKLASEMLYRDTIDSLHTRFKRIYDSPPFKDFEKQAIARYGAGAEKPLQDLRHKLSLPEVEYNLDTIKKEAGFIDDSTVEMRLLNEAIDYNNKAAELSTALNKIGEKV